MRAFVSRVAMFSRYTPREVIEESIVEFCEGHNISFLCFLVRILVNIKDNIYVKVYFNHGCSYLLWM